MALVNTLKGTSQDFTASWVDYGPEIGTDGYSHMSIWLDIDINDTTNARFRILGKHTSGGADEYTLPIKSVSSSVVSIQAEYYEFDVDVDGKHVIAFDLEEVIPFIQIQIQAGKVGDPAGKILSSKYVER